MGYYSRDELIVLILVVVLGAGRTTLTKIYFQLGYDDPFFVTALVLAGHALALPAYLIRRRLTSSKLEEDPYTPAFEKKEKSREDEEDHDVMSQVEVASISTNILGSTTGLNRNSAEAIQWIHKIPYFAKPFITSIFGLLDALFRVSSVLFLPASIADMLITGLELFFIIVAQKLIRKRHILRQRWIGSGIVIVGLVVVTSADYIGDKGGGSNTDARSLGLGLACVFGKVLAGAGLDMSQELFTQEANIPAILLLGMEAVCGLVIFIPLYFATAPLTGYNPVDAVQKAASSPEAISFTIALIFMMFIAGIFQILGTTVTSSMTRNLWITSFRGPTVWIIALIVYYAGGGSIGIGEPWYIPGSFVILIGVIVIFGGVNVYYSNMNQAKSKTKKTGADQDTEEFGTDEFGGSTDEETNKDEECGTTEKNKGDCENADMYLDKDETCGCSDQDTPEIGGSTDEDTNKDEECGTADKKDDMTPSDATDGAPTIIPVSVR